METKRVVAVFAGVALVTAVGALAVSPDETGRATLVGEGPRPKLAQLRLPETSATGALEPRTPGAAAPAPAGPDGARVHVSVHTSAEVPVWPGDVLLVDASGCEARRAALDRAGRASLEHVPPATYVVRLDPASLQPPFRAPWLQDEPGYAPSVRATAGSELDVAIRAHLETRILGTVSADLGPARTEVWLFSQRPHERGRAIRLRTDAAGRYEGAVPPGTWRAVVRLALEDGVDPADVETHPYVHLTHPLPRRVDLAEGTVTRIDLHFEQGPGAIHGRVVDLHTGRPAAGLHVSCHPYAPAEALAARGEYPHGASTDAVAHATTDAGGAFVLSSLPHGSYSVKVAPGGWSPWLGRGRSVVGRETEPVGPVDVRGTSDVGTVGVWLSRPFVVQGRVLLDPRWAAPRSVSPEMLRARLVLPPWSPGRPPRVAEHDVDPSGAFEAWCETPEGPVTLELVAPDGTTVTEPDLLPTPDTTVAVVVPFPR